MTKTAIPAQITDSSATRALSMSTIAFGVLNDLTGIWSSCFMLLFLLVAACLAWMHLAIRRMEKGSEASAEPLTQAAQ